MVKVVVVVVGEYVLRHDSEKNSLSLIKTVMVPQKESVLPAAAVLLTDSALCHPESLGALGAKHSCCWSPCGKAIHGGGHGDR